MLEEWVNRLELLKFIRLLGGGGLLGAGCLGILFLFFPGIFPPDVTIEIVLIIGALLGGGLNWLAQSLFTAVLVVIKKISEKEIEKARLEKVKEVLNLIAQAKDTGLINDEIAQKLASKWLEKFVLNSIISDNLNQPKQLQKYEQYDEDEQQET